jgi:hypothetical protein
MSAAIIDAIQANWMALDGKHYCLACKQRTEKLETSHDHQPQRI